MTIVSQDIAGAAACLVRGIPVAIPTETVYGLAANAYDPEAVMRIFQLKRRPLFDPLIVHVGRSWFDLDALTRHGVVDGSRLDEAQRQTFTLLSRNFWPGPLTMLMPRGARIPDLVCSGLATVGVRMPAHPMSLELLARLSFPLAAPSANRFGRVSPTSAEHVTREFGDELTFILDGGPCDTGVESTVVAIGAGGALTVVRPGGISVERLAAVSGRAVEVETRPGAALQNASPGTLENHYAPAIPLVSYGHGGNALPRLDGISVAVLAMQSTAMLATMVTTAGGQVVHEENLCTGGGLLSDIEAAHRLFGAMRRCGESGARLIIAEPVSRQDGLWLAIADRLRKAAFKGSVEQLLAECRGSR